MKWKDVVSQIGIGGVVTIVAGVTLFYLTDRSPKLRYTLTEGPDLPIQSATEKIYLLRVANEGRREADTSDIVLDFEFHSADASGIQHARLDRCCSLQSRS